MPNQRTRERKRQLQQQQQQQQQQSASVASGDTEPGEEVVSEPGNAATANGEAQGLSSSEATVPTMDGRQQGVCRWYKEAKRFGFISSKNGGDIFVHAMDLKQLEIAEGDTLEYSVVQFKGRPKAIDVVKVKDAEPKEDATQKATESVEDNAEVNGASSGNPSARRELGQDDTANAEQQDTAATVKPAEKSGLVDDVRRTGTTAWYTPKKKHGFIKPDQEGQRDIFVHALDLRDGVPISEGDRVEYNVAYYQDKIKAVDVAKLPADSQPQPTSASQQQPAAAAADKQQRKAAPPRPKQMASAWGQHKSTASTDTNNKAWANAARGTPAPSAKSAPVPAPKPASDQEADNAKAPPAPAPASKPEAT